MISCHGMGLIDCEMSTYLNGTGLLMKSVMCGVVCRQIKFLEIIEFLVFSLNFIPCKELITISIIIKTNQ